MNPSELRYWCICEEDGHVRFTPISDEADLARGRGDDVEEVVPIGRLVSAERTLERIRDRANSAEDPAMIAQGYLDKLAATRS